MSGYQEPMRISSGVLLSEAKKVLILMMIEMLHFVQHDRSSDRLQERRIAHVLVCAASVSANIGSQGGTTYAWT